MKTIDVNTNKGLIDAIVLYGTYLELTSDEKMLLISWLYVADIKDGHLHLMMRRLLKVLPDRGRTAVNKALEIMDGYYLMKKITPKGYANEHGNLYSIRALQELITKVHNKLIEQEEGES